MAEQKKRTAWTVQDVINGKNDDTGTIPKFKSGYSGPKKSTASVMSKYNFSGPAAGGPSAPSGVRTSNVRRSGGILDYAWLVFAGIIVACLVLAICIYCYKSVSHDGIYYPTRIPTVGGVVKEIFEEYKSGGLGSRYASSGGAVADGSNVGAEPGEDESVDEQNLLGATSENASTPNSTTGATMAIDSGSAYGDYNSATTYDELLEQLKRAFAANDFGFIGMKLCYTDEQSNNLIGYPQSVVQHFTQYMFDNPAKCEAFLSEIKDADTYMAKNAAAFVVKLPRLQFTINMGYDGTTVSISGFSDQQMDSGQSAVVSPLLPCMYTINVSTSGGSQSSEVECNMNEGNLQINIGVTN